MWHVFDRRNEDGLRGDNFVTVMEIGPLDSVRDILYALEVSQPVNEEGEWQKQQHVVSHPEQDAFAE